MTEWNATDYRRQSSLQETMAQTHLAKLELRGSERVLDIGCGDGRITAAIAARVPNGSVLGVDPSHRMVEYASAQFGPPDHSNLRFEVGDARTLPYQSEFDLVISFNALHWVPEQEKALKSIRKALRPGGSTLLQFVGHGTRTSLEHVIRETRQSERWSGYFAEFHRPYIHLTTEEYGALARQAGLEVLHITLEDNAWDFGSREGFMAWCRATFVEWTQHVAEEERDNFIADVLDRYQPIAASTPAEANTFKFYQMEAVLARPRHDG